MKKRIRVLHVVQNLNYGGMERLIAELARRVDTTDFESHVLGIQYLGRFADDVGSAAVLHEGVNMGRFSLLRPTALAARIAAIAPDVVHTHSGVWLKAASAAQLAGVARIVHTEHGRRFPDPWHDRAIDRVAAARTHVVIAVSRPLAHHLADRVLPRGPDLRVINNGVDTTAFTPTPASGAVRAELGISPERLVLGSIGRLEPIKGYDVAIKAYSLLRAGWDHVAAPPVLLLVGDGSQRQALELQARELGCAEDVKFVGWRDDVTALHSIFSLFTLPSRSEGTSVSLLEAMSAGICPVVTDVGGNREVLGPRLAHRLVPSENPGALAASWHQALLDDEGRARDGVAARQRVIDEFDVRNMVHDYEAVYADR